MSNTTKTTPWMCPYPPEKNSRGPFGLQTNMTPARLMLKGLEVSLTAVMMAGGFYALSTLVQNGGQLLAALAGTSALIYLDLLLESPNLARRLINLVAPPAIFTAAYFSLNGPASMLAVAFALHALAAAGQLPTHDGERDGLLWFWLVFNALLAGLVL